MGYANPRININKSLEVINTEARNFTKQFNYEFGKMNDMRIANFKENQKYLEKQKAKKMMGENAWHEMYGKYEPKGGYEAGTEAYIKDLHDRYYKSLDCDEPECVTEQRNLLNQAKELSENGGSFAAAKQMLDQAGNITGVSPGALDPYSTPGGLVDILTHGQELRPVYDAATGHTNYQRVDAKGNPVGDMIDGRGFTRALLSGEQSISTYGDPANIAKEIHKGAYDNLGIENLGISEIDKTDPEYQTKVKDYTQARKVYEDAIADPRLYEPTLNNTKEMHRNWPVMVTDMVETANSGGPGSAEAKLALAPLLGGNDGIYGTADDSPYTAQAASGQWDGSDMQRDIALAYFTKDNPLDGIMPPLSSEEYGGRETESVVKGTGKDKGMTDYQRATTTLNREKFEQKREEANRIAEDNATKPQKGESLEAYNKRINRDHTPGADMIWNGAQFVKYDPTVTEENPSDSNAPASSSSSSPSSSSSSATILTPNVAATDPVEISGSSPDDIKADITSKYPNKNTIPKGEVIVYTLNGKQQYREWDGNKWVVLKGKPKSSMRKN